MDIAIDFDDKALKRIEETAKRSAVSTLELLMTDLVSSEVMPFDTGDMQNNQTFVAESDDDKVSLVTGSPQARRLYYHPEYKFQQGKNSNAGAKWLEPYISGGKKDFIPETFAKLLKHNL